MFDAKLQKPRGFSGRPLIALLFALGIGALAYYAGLWFHLGGLTTFVIIVASVGVVGTFGIAPKNQTSQLPDVIGACKTSSRI
jgi:hypothetical protein